MSHRTLAGLLLLAALGCALPARAQTAPAADFDEYDEYAVGGVSDPLEPVNRAVFTFNDYFYDYAARPVVRGYEFVVPRPARDGLVNFFDNVRYPVRLVGCVLQGRFGRAGRETGKFVINTLGGLGGFMRQSERIPALADVPAEDLGQAFGRWGIGHGPYLVLPVFGGGSIRDLVGRAGDAVIAPSGWDYVHLGGKDWMEALGWEANTAISVADTVSGMPRVLKLYDDMKASALDPYLSVRDALLSYRDKAVEE